MNTDVFENNTAEVKSKNNKKLILIIVLVGILVLVIGGFIGFKVLNSKPIDIYENALNISYKEMSKLLDEVEENSIKFDPKNESFKLSGNVLIDSDYPGLEKLGDNNYDYTLAVDLKNEQMEASIGMNEESKKLLTIFAYLLNDNVYLQSEELYEKILLVETGENIEINTDDIPAQVDYSDIDFLIERLKNYAIASLIEEQFTQEKDNILIDGSKVSVKSNIYTIDDKTAQKMFDSIIESMLNDKEFINKIAKITDISEDDVIENLEMYKDDDYFEGMDDIKIKIFTQGFTNKFVGFSLEENNIVYLTYTKGKDKSELLLSEDGENNFLTVTQKDEVINMKFEDDSIDGIFEIDITQKSKENILMDLNYEYDETAFKCNIDLTSEKKSDKKANMEMVLDCNINMDTEEMNFKLDINNTTEVGTKLSNINVNNAQNIELLSDDEMLNILENLEKAVKGTIFEDLLSSMMDY